MQSQFFHCELYMDTSMRILVALLAYGFAIGSALADGLPEVEVWKDPNCGCCVKWIDHLQQNGFEVKAHNVARVDSVRAKLGMPHRYGSCHTAKVAGYVIEGHVPAADIKHLIEQRPMARGLAVPGMPVGSPGMEGPYSEPYQTLLIGLGDKARVFAEH